MFFDSACCCLRTINWSQVFSGEWRCCWSSADRRCSNYIWVINNFMAYSSAAYIKDLTVGINGMVVCYQPCSGGQTLIKSPGNVNDVVWSIRFNSKSQLASTTCRNRVKLLINRYAWCWEIRALKSNRIQIRSVCNYSSMSTLQRPFS